MAANLMDASPCTNAPATHLPPKLYDALHVYVVGRRGWGRGDTHGSSGFL